MKRYGNLFEQITDIKNIKSAIRKAAKHKKNRREIRRILHKLNKYARLIKELLESGDFTTSSYKISKIYEPKERTIYILPFYPDRIVHHTIMNIVAPIWDRSFIYHSYSCREGKGQIKGSIYTMYLVKKYKYCLKCDISKFYPNINHQLLKDLIRLRIKDKKTLALLDDIIDSIDGETNVPIGNYISQWLGNLYLTVLDMMVKHKWKITAYVRYCDDFCFYSNSKEELNYIKNELPIFLHDKLRLTLSKCDLFRTTQGVDFLGYRHFPNGVILVRKSTAKRQMRSMKRLESKIENGEISRETAIGKIASAHGICCHANAHNLENKLNLKNLRNKVDEYLA